MLSLRHAFYSLALLEQIAEHALGSSVFFLIDVVEEDFLDHVELVVVVALVAAR